MTSLLALLAVLGDVVIALVLVAAVASPRVSQLARLLVATCAFACAWLLTATFDALRAPGLTTFTGGALILVSIGVITVTVHLWTRGGIGGQDDAGQGSADGGDGPHRGRPDAPRPGGRDSEPSWWPEFERQVAFYVAEREREKRRSAVLRDESAPHATKRRSRRREDAPIQ